MEFLTINEEANNERVWTDKENFLKLSFTGEPGLKNNLNNNSMAIDYFYMFLDNDILRMIVDMTNATANKFKNDLDKNLEWNSLTILEFKNFLGLTLHMGNIVLPSIYDYWKSDELYDFPIFRNTMSRSRFLCIFKFLTFGDKGSSDDRLEKVRFLSNHFNKIMEEQYYPSRELCIDESMMGFKGKLLFRQFIKNKKHKFGVKFYILTEPNGLILKHRIYDGTKIEFDGSSSATESIVLDLMKNYLSKGHSLYMDNFYNSIKLSERLLKFATYSTGTLRSNRKLNPREVVRI
uniref:DDE_Tnp_1_7 domain-containing protein n=1 Tax=Strongyloides papillosus TaxID=174720 RepID=A0A0N5BH23_STREA